MSPAVASTVTLFIPHYYNYVNHPNRNRWKIPMFVRKLPAPQFQGSEITACGFAAGVEGVWDALQIRKRLGYGTLSLPFAILTVCP